MINRTFKELVQDLKQRREVGDLPPVVLLGAGASVETGIGAMVDLFQFVGCTGFEQFCDYIDSRSASERYRLLSRFLQSRQPTHVTPGYQALSALCAAAYFDTILTTNLDPLLEDALSHARLWRKDYLLLVNGIIQPDWLKLLLTAQSPRVKVLKMHGDLFHRCMAWTPAEMDRFLADIAPQLKLALAARDVLVVGYSLRDERIRELVLEAGGTIWYTHPDSVPDFLTSNEKVRAVVGKECKFERLFTELAQALGLRPTTEEAPKAGEKVARPTVAIQAATTMDDFMASVVALATPKGQPVCTGFVLADPRLIITDGYSGNTHQFSSEQVSIITVDKRHLRTRVIRHESSHPFGPLLLQVPDEFKVSGLRLDVTPFEQNLLVHIGVAAGERVGVSSGLIEHLNEQRQSIVPIGEVDRLIAIEAVVAPGASGAPVVDDKMAVRGFIVAGSTDRPPSLMYPAYRWASNLAITT